METVIHEDKRMAREKRFGYIEAFFDIAYLCSVLVLGGVLLANGDAEWRSLAGVMACTLAVGDAFHLVPRIAVAFSAEPERLRRSLGIGKLFASITMTVFYVMLWHVGLLLLVPDIAALWTYVVWLLACLRVLLCLLPQNRWFDAAQPRTWGIIRNLPFLLLGAAVAIMFGIYGGAVPYIRWMWLTILFSFAFYFTVVLGANKYPVLGMFMLPKSVAYILAISLCVLA